MDGSRTAPATVLAIHDLAASKENFLLPTALEGVRLLSVDRLGHGGSSDEPAGYGIDQMCRDWAEMLDALNIQGVYIIGHGLGGTVSCTHFPYMRV